MSLNIRQLVSHFRQYACINLNWKSRASLTPEGKATMTP